MSEIKRIVILGASISGLSVAHYLAKHTLPSLLQSGQGRYELHLVDQSTHFWWHFAAPRAIVSVKEAKHSEYFVPIMKNFEQYTTLKDRIHFHHGKVTDMDPTTRTIKIATQEGSETLQYFALVIATGNLSPTPLTTLQGDHTVTQKALDDMNVQLSKAKSIVIGGGGPIAVETAGELGTHLTNAKIVLIAGSSRILPVLGQSLADKAASKLESYGVTVRYNVKVKHTRPTATATMVELDNGENITADVYLPCVGVTPSTAFVPETLKHGDGRLKTNVQTLRLDAAGPLVYAVGDVANVDMGGMLPMFSALPVAHANISHDLFETAMVPGAPAEKTYERKDSQTQIVPLGRKTGVGAFNGWRIPGFVVSFAKGRDYMRGQMPPLVEGTKW